MDDDRSIGAGRQVKGSIKEAIGKITGDRSAEAEGAAEKAAGKVQSALGKAKQAARDAKGN
ncbi:CsbD-like protein [Sphingomonas sp. Leaf357]|uniref:CsbD family protein n=1 Tax=Sphingomonas sp. Leaf357 TaxID=1736350 RepID=UPI000700CAE0|nr:CsbD family protein [Sphingomonas sp. Leaf357]KQS02995.1 CsbD-like protein [Sphingomonas sp. Leaf357]